ncbi:MAG TPA: restriction endonuclease [Myxococcaceae bacterium]|nr:restriction endonuclease [Myxococcaceae bacterium]
MIRRRNKLAQGAPDRLHRTAGIPQANRLENVRQLVAAVREGIHHPAALLELLEVDERHFAYYRQAAAILGLVSVGRDGALALTERGRELLATAEGSTAERKGFREAVQAARSLRPFHSFFEGEALPIDELSRRLQALTGLSATTAARRAQTLEQWRRYIQPAAPEAGPGLPELTPRLDSLIARHNALAKQRFLEWMQRMAPAAFERLIGELAAKLGYTSVQVRGRPGDGGVDIIATKVTEWEHPAQVAIQVKRYARPVGRRHVDELLGVLARERHASGILVTTSDFSQDARRAAAQDNRLQLLNGAQLVNLLAERGVGVRLGRYGELVSVEPEPG